MIAILAALLVPAAGAAREAALRAKSRARFAQWIAAIEAFRGEYGHYPAFPGGKINGGSGAGGAIAPEDTLFREVLTGRGTGAGSPPAFQSSEGNLTSGTPRALNPKRTTFYTFAADEISAGGCATDAFGNTDLTVLVDADGDGVIPAAEILAAATRVRPSGGDAAAPGAGDVPADGVRASVVVFSAGAGWSGSAVDPTRMILSWK